MQENLYSLSCSAKDLFAIFTSSLVSVHSTTSLSINFFLHLQFSYSKYSPILHDLSHSHPKLLEFQINPFITNSFINQFFTFAFEFILIPSLFIITNGCISSTFTFTSFMKFYVSCFISS